MSAYAREQPLVRPAGSYCYTEELAMAQLNLVSYPGKEFSRELCRFIADWHAESEFIVAHTSGSTGAPKEICLLKSDMRVSARATNTFFGINTDSVIGMALSAEYIAGKMMAVRAIESGATLCPLPVSNEIDLTETPPLDLLAIVPSQMNNFAEHPEFVSKVRNLLVGGAAPDAGLCNRLALLGYKVFISYGMTETCSHVALAAGADPYRIFHAVEGISFDVTDDHRLVIECPKFSFRRLVTNDVVELISKYDFKWRGRADGVINSGGLKFYPEELEAMYSLVLGDLIYYVCGVSDEKWGTAVALVFEGDETLSVSIKAALESVIADRRRLPHHYIAVAALPRTANGKIRRNGHLL